MKVILFPGQGTQFTGMGRDLFPAYRELAELASETLGYSIEKLCLENREKNLRLTQYTQPAVYVVNALRYYRTRDEAATDSGVDFVAGHSLGEYNALLAAGVFDFETGLKLVKKRGELMAAVGGGSMAAVMGVGEDDVREVLREHGLDSVDLVNFNTPTQFIISGPTDAIAEAEKVCASKKIRCILLNVTGPFHSRYMVATQKVFEGFLRDYRFDDPKIPTIANTTARPHEAGAIARALASQIASPVLWTESIRYLIRQGATEFIEMGGSMLTKMVEEIRRMDVTEVA